MRRRAAMARPSGGGVLEYPGRGLPPLGSLASSPLQRTYGVRQSAPPSRCLLLPYGTGTWRVSVGASQSPDGLKARSSPVTGGRGRRSGGRVNVALRGSTYRFLI